MLNAETLEIHEVTFEVMIKEAQLNIRFPCKIFVSWRSPSNKILAKTVNDHADVKNGVAEINETLASQSFVLYDSTTTKYQKK